MANSRRTEYEIAMLIGGQVQASFGNSINEISKSFDQVASMARTAAKVAATAFAAVNIGQFISDSVETYSQFEQSMANTAATANAGRLQYEQMEKAAREMGRATTKTASEAADALGYMMLAGWDVEEAIAGLEPVLRLSEATQMDLAACSDLVTDSMSALGLSVEELSGYLDVCTAANNSANTSAEALMEAFIGCGGTAKTIGADLNDVATALGILANNGTKGSEAGTALNSMLVRMTSKDAAIKAMKELGVSAFDSSGKFIGLNEVLVDLQEALSKLTDEEQAAYMSSIAGTNYYTEMSYLLDAVGKSTVELAENSGEAERAWEELADTAGINLSAWDSLSGKLEDSDGALTKMAETVTDTLPGAFSRLNSAVDDAKISFAGAFSGDLKDMINGLAEHIPEMTEGFIEFAENAGPKVFTTFRAVSKGAGELWDIACAIGGGIMDHFGLIETLIAGIGGAVVTYKVVSGLAGVAGGIKGIAVAIKVLSISNPLLLGATAAISAIAGIAAAVKTAEKQAVQSSLAKHFGDIALSMEDISRVADYIVMTDSLSSVRQSLEAFDELEGIQSSIQGSLDAIDKMNWKASIGMELSEDERRTYAEEIENYVNQTLAYVQQQQYASNLNLEPFAEGDLERQNIVDKLNEFYSDKYSELSELGTKLNQAVSEAFLDGFLDPDEAKEIAELQASMARIQEAMATSDFDAKLKVMELQYSGAELDEDSFQRLQEELAEQTASASAEYEETLRLRIAQVQVLLDDGSMDQSEYDAAVKEFWEDYLTNMSEMEAKSLNFQTNTIMKAYSEELGPAISDYMQYMQDVIDEYSGEDMLWQWKETPVLMWESMLMDLEENGLDKTSRKAVEKLLSSMQPSIEQVEELKKQFTELGMELPQSLLQTLTDTETLNALTMDSESIFFVLGQQLEDNEYFSDVISMLREEGFYVPDALAEGISAGTPDAVSSAMEEMYEYSKGYLDHVFSSGLSTNVDIQINGNPNMSILDPSISSSKVFEAALGVGAAGMKVSRSGKNLIGHAEGGIFTVPHMAWFAEKGPEAAIPLDGSSSAVALWEQTGKLLGVMDGGVNRSRGEELYRGIAGSQTVNNSSVRSESADNRQFIFSPQIHMDAGTSGREVSNALNYSYEEFCDFFERYEAERQRVSMAR